MKAFFEKIPNVRGETFACREFRVPRFTSPWHFHREWELTLIVRGRGMRYVGDSIQRFHDGDLVFLGPDLPHYWWNDAEDRTPAHSVVVQFDSRFGDNAIFDLPEAVEVRRLFHDARRGLVFSRRRSARVAENLMRMSGLQGWNRVCLLLEILGDLASQKRPRGLASASYAPELHSRDVQRLTAVCQYVNQSHAEQIEHEKAARMAGFSPAAFSRFFRERMGKTFTTYVAEVRIGHACRHLLEEDASVVEVALSSGFNNLANFNRHFLKIQGVTPSAYRKLTRHPVG